MTILNIMKLQIKNSHFKFAGKFVNLLEQAVKQLFIKNGTT